MALLWFLLALAVGILFSRAALPGIAPASDLWDYSQEARQIARGEGFTSLYTYPLFLGASSSSPYPVLWRMPLYALLGALLLKLGIALPGGFLYLGAFAHALLVALTYLLGAKVHSTRAGSWAAACALACPILLDFYNPGMSQAPATVLAVMVWLLLLGSGGMRSAILAALPAAGAWYLRGESLLMVPIWLWVAARGTGGGAPRWTRAAAFAAVYALICIPWVIASQRAHGGYSIQGNPMLLYTSLYPGYSSSRTLGAELPGMLEYVSHHPAEFAVRYAKDIVGYVIDLLDGIGPIALGAAFAGIAIRGSITSWPRLGAYGPMLVAIALQILAMSALERSPRFLVPVLPLVLVLVGVAAAPVLDRLAKNGAVIALLLAVVLERGARVLYQHTDALRRFPPVSERTASSVLDRARAWPRGGLVLSDAPDWIAWHLDRPALFLPLLSQVDSLSSARQIDAIWLSPVARDRNVADRDTAWVGKMDRGESLQGYAGPRLLPGGSRVYVRETGGTVP